MKKLKQKVQKVVDYNNETGRKRKTFKYLEDMGVMLGPRPAILPPVTILSGREYRKTDLDQEEEGESGDSSGKEDSPVNISEECMYFIVFVLKFVYFYNAVLLFRNFRHLGVAVRY